MTNGNDPRPLRALDPTRDPERLERLVGGILAATGPELARRAEAHAARASLLLGLSDWLRPALAAAALLAFLALAALLGGGARADVEPPPGLTQALGYPAPVATWVETERTPSVEEVLISLEGGHHGR
jgi:hypothetical protein